MHCEDCDTELQMFLVEALSTQPRTITELETLLASPRNYIKDQIQSHYRVHSNSPVITYDQKQGVYLLVDQERQGFDYMTQQLSEYSTRVNRMRRGTLEPMIRQFGKTEQRTLTRHRLIVVESDLKLIAKGD